MEVYLNGIWGTICSNGFDLNDAQVVCIESGIGNAVAVKRNAFYGKGNGKIWLDNIDCVGTELTVTNCSHRGWGIEYCKHIEDVGVKCVSGMYVAFLYHI